MKKVFVCWRMCVCVCVGWFPVARAIRVKAALCVLDKYTGQWPVAATINIAMATGDG